MSWLSDHLRRRRVSPSHQTRRHFSRHIAKHGFEIGEYTYGLPEVFFGRSSKARLIIGSYCSIADGVEILLGVEHRSDWVSTFPFKETKGFDSLQKERDQQFHAKGDVVIGSDVWIGTGATILSGVKIGHGAIIGARAVVSRDVPPYAVAVGNPARIVRMRFPEETIHSLLDIEWWNFSREDVARLVPLLQDSDAHALIQRARELKK